MTTGGIGTYIQYAKQTNFTTPVSAGAMTRSFGIQQRVTSLSLDERITAHYDLNSPIVQAYSWGKFDGTFAVEAKLSTPWVHDLFLGNATTTGTGPYTHTYDDSKTVNAFTTEIGIDTDTDQVLQLQRCTIEEYGVSAEVDGEVTANISARYGDTPTTAGTSLDTSVVTDDMLTPYTFASGAILQYPTGTALAEVQGFSLTVRPNIRHVSDANQNKSVNAYKGALELEGSFSLALKDNTWWNKVRARTAPNPDTMSLKFTNGLTGTSERTIEYKLSGLGLSRRNLRALDPAELVIEEIPLIFKDLQVVAVNNTAVPP